MDTKHFLDYNNKNLQNRQRGQSCVIQYNNLQTRLLHLADHPFFHLFYHMTVLLAFFCKDNRPICLHATRVPRNPYLPGRLQGEAAGKLSVSMTFQRQRILFFWQ